ncbi:sugar phosphate isomerase/epimerase family protein [Agromyces sp. NPDC052230]
MNADLDVACHLNVLVADAAPERLGTALDALAAAGYRRVVLPPLDPETADAAALARAFADRGLAPITIAGQMPTADVSSSDAAVRADGAAMLRAALDLTVALGGDQMNGVPYGPFGGPTAPVGRDAFERAAIEVGRIADEAHERGVTMTFEVLNRYETAVVNTAAQAMDFVAASGSDHLRIHLDTFHMAVEEADLAAAIRTALPKLGYLELGQSGRGALSSGVVDVVDVVRQALDDGYRGRWGVEAFSRSVLPAPVADMLAIWREPYDDGLELAADALRVIDAGRKASTAGRAA